MNRANRQEKFKKYEVVITREIQHRLVLEVEARSVEEAEGIGAASADAMDNHWLEDHVIDQKVKAKVVRGS